MFKAIAKNDKNMANGMRNCSGKRLTDEEIEIVKQEIRAIDADESKFIFNDEKHIHRSTCYSYDEDNDTPTTPLWQDECRASITAAKITPNLSDLDKQNLILDAIYRADEAFQYIELDDFMKGVLYGYSKNERNITPTLERITYVSKTSEMGLGDRFNNLNNLPQVSHTSDADDYAKG